MTAIAAGDFHNLALKQDGTVVAWGNNDYGQRQCPSGAEQGDRDRIAAGEYHSLALKQDGTVVAMTAIAAGYHSLAMRQNATSPRGGERKRRQAGRGVGRGDRTSPPAVATAWR